jgi:hypothetical protein
MKTLKANISANYLKQAKSPRLLVRIPDADIYAGTADAYDEFTDTIESTGRLTQSIPPYGGMATVSNFTLNDLVLGRRVTLCTEATISPQSEGSVHGAGRLVGESGFGGAYLTARNATTGTLATAVITVGRGRYSDPESYYEVYRGFAQFTIPSDLTTCEDAVIEVPYDARYYAVAFTLYGVLGNWTALSSGSAIFNDFDGWAASGAYSPTVLTETVDPSIYSVGDTMKFRFSLTGRNEVVTAAGGILTVMFLSTRDAAAESASSLREYIVLNSADIRLKLRYNSKTLLNKDASVYYGYDPLPTLYTDMQLIFKGVDDDYAISKGKLSLILKSNDLKKNVMIPGSVFNTTDYPFMRENDIGKAIPIVYGDFLTEEQHKEFIAYVMNENTSAQIAHHGLVKMYAERLYESRYIIAGHSIKTLDNIAAFWYSNGFGFIAADIVAVTGQNNKIVQLTDGADELEFPYRLTSPEIDGTPTYSVNGVLCFIPQVVADYVDDDQYNAVNTNPDDYTLLQPPPIALPVYWWGFDGNGYRSIGGADTLTDWYLCYYTEKQNAGAYDGNTSIYFYGGIEAPDSWTISANGWHWHRINDTHVRQDGTLAFYVYFSNTTSTDIIKFSNICMCVGVQANRDELYIACQGRPDDGSGTVTGTASALIENPAHVIESLARSEIGLATAEIDTAAFDTAATSMTGLKYAFQLLRRQQSRDILNDLLEQAACKGFWDEQDRLSIIKFSATAGFTHSGTDIPAALDIIDNTGLPSGGSLTRHAWMSEPEIRLVEPRYFNNNFVLKYAQNYATNEYSKVLTCNKTSTNVSDANLSGTTGAALVALCAASVTKYGVENTLEFEAWAIRDDATAARLLQHLVERMSTWRYEVEGQVDMSVIEHDLGDIINPRTDRISDLFGEAAAERKKWEIITMEQNFRGMNTTNIVAIEV